MEEWLFLAVTLMAQLSLLQTETERHGDSESYRIVTVYAAAMESFTDHHP